MSYEKALRVVDVIAARNHAQVARVALAEVKSILNSLIFIRDSPGAPVEPVERIVARADPDSLPAYLDIQEPLIEGARRTLSTRAARGWVHPKAWSEERRQALFDYLGTGKQVPDACNHFKITNQMARYQIQHYIDANDPRITHLHKRNRG